MKKSRKKKELHELFAVRIKESGFKQKYVAAHIGVSESHLCNILKGHDVMTEEWKEKIEKFLKEKAI